MDSKWFLEWSLRASSGFLKGLLPVSQKTNAEALLVSLGDQTAGEGLDEDGEQDDPGLGEQPVVAALLPTEG